MASEQDTGSLHPEQFKNLHKAATTGLSKLAEQGVSIDPMGALSIHGHVFPLTMPALSTHHGEDTLPILSGSLPNELHGGVHVAVKPTNEPSRGHVVELMPWDAPPRSQSTIIPLTDPELIPKMREVVNRRGTLSQPQAERISNVEKGTVGRLRVTHFLGGAQAHHGTYDTRTGKLSGTSAEDWGKDYE